MQIRKTESKGENLDPGSWVRFDKYRGYWMLVTQGCVSFRNHAPKAFLLEISIYEDKDGYKQEHIDITPCLSSYNKVAEIFKKFFNKSEYLAISEKYYFKIKINPHITIDKVIKLLKYINEEIQNEIPSVLFTELQLLDNTISLYRKSPPEESIFLHPMMYLSKSHVIPEDISWLEKTNRPRDMTLVTLVLDSFLAPRFSHDSILKKIKIELKRFANVNEIDASGRSIIYLLVRYFLNEEIHSLRQAILELVLSYGAANFFERDNGLFYTSAFEEAYINKDLGALRLFQSAFSKLKKQISITPNGVDLFKHHDRYVYATYVHFKRVIDKKTVSEHIFTHLKPLDQMAAHEKKQIAAIFLHYFQHPSKDKKIVASIFERDFAPCHKKWIDIYYNAKGEIIGFNMFELLKDTSDPGRYSLLELLQEKDLLSRLTVHIMYTAVLPDYRDLGIVKPLAFRFAFSLQRALKNCKVGVFFCAIHPNSFRLVSNFKVFPKYSDTDGFPPHILNVLQQVYEGDLRLYFDGTQQCYILEDDALTVADKINHDITNIFFCRHITGESVEVRGAPIYFDAAENEAAFLKGSILTGKHLDGLAQFIEKMPAEYVKAEMPCTAISVRSSKY